MAENPLKIYESLDPGLLKQPQETQQFALAEGVIPRKYKFLIAMALDASLGAVDGVSSLARGAMRVGATKEEIAETLRVVQYICGASAVYTAARGLRDVFPAEPIRPVP